MRPLIIAMGLALTGCSSTGFMGQAARLACPTLELAAELSTLAISVPAGLESVPLPFADMAAGLVTFPCRGDQAEEDTEASA